jgi:hypothetical protein
MLYNELEQEDILSGVRLRLATIAYGDILLRSIGLVYKIRQTPVTESTGETNSLEGLIQLMLFCAFIFTMFI